jgi:glycosyltransferase involved in cell wall biosynthesis
MAHGAVPLVYPGGGQAEIVADRETGLYWRSTGELVERSLELASDAARRDQLAERGRAQAARYGRERFAQAVRARVLIAS